MAASSPRAQERASPPTFRADVDVIEVDVQVIDRDGTPVPDLTAEQFDVRIGGQSRRVVAAEFVRYGVPEQPVETSARSPAGDGDGLWPEPEPVPAPSRVMAGRRLFMLAIDASSFSGAEARGPAIAARRFVDGLPADDLVGLFTYPLGPKVDPTTEHEQVVVALDRVVGQRASTGGLGVQASEVVDYFADPQALGAIRERYCADDRGCLAQLDLEIRSSAGIWEVQAQAGLGMLRDMIDQLASVPGRKILVLASAGLAISDRPGGRPDIGDLPIQLGQAAARANVAIYSLFVDRGPQAQFSAEQRFARRQLLNVARESELLAHWLDRFSGAGGGSMMKVMVDSGEVAFDRIARETSAHYVLAVEPALSDRSGRARRVEVRVTHPGVTVRAREWVVLPE